MDAEVFIAFCRRLLQDDTGPVFLIEDGHPAPTGAVEHLALVTIPPGLSLDP